MSTITANASIKFKHGSQKNLDNLKLAANASSIEVGAFYLTHDTHRMYIGVQEGSGDSVVNKLVPVNEGITTYTSTTLPDATDSNAGQFAYIDQTGILCVSNGTSWVQLNHDSNTLYEYEGAVKEETNAVTIAQTLTAINNTATNADESGEAVEFNFTLLGENGVVLSVDGNNITIYGTKLGYTVSEGEALIQLKDKNDTQSSAIALTAGTNITITENAASNGISISAKDTTLDGLNTHGSALDQGFEIVAVDGSNASSGGQIDPLITYGAAGSETVHFVNGTATLDVYTKEEVDELRASFDAMEYQGVISAQPAASSGIRKGFTWKAGENFTFTDDNGNTITLKVGDLLIANAVTGAEDEGKLDSADIIWEVVPSGNEDTTYDVSAAGTGITISETPMGGSAQTIGGISIVGETGNPIAVTGAPDTTDNINTITVKHNTITRGSESATGSVNGVEDFNVKSTTINIVDADQGTNGIDTDAYGHISKVYTKKYTIYDTNASLEGVSAAAASGTTNQVSVTVGAVLRKSDNSADEKESSVYFESANKNLSVTAHSGKNVKFDLVWDTF